MKDKNDWQLGQTSEQYESGGYGPGTVSSGKGDYGGVSYGTYQLSTNAGTLQEYLNQSAYKNWFKEFEPKTPAFDAKWRELASTDSGFGQDQHNFIKKTHYDKQVAYLKEDGLDLTNRGPAVQDALWSTSVQYRNLTRGIFEEGLKEKFGKDYKLSNLSDKDIVEAIQNYKIKHNDRLFKNSSPNVRNNLLNRAENEKADLLNLADGKPVDRRAHTHGASLHAAANDTLRQGTHSQAVSALQADLGRLGYYADAQKNALKPDGHFGPATKAAVKTFQREHGLTADGVAGPKTLGTLHSQSQTQATPSPAEPNASRDPGHPDHATYQPALSFHAGPNHPGYGLYKQLKERLPDASEDRLVQFTAACHVKGITDKNLGDIYLLESTGAIRFHRSWPPGPAVHVDLTAPMPSPQQALQQVQDFGQQQAIQQAQVQAQQMQLNQPQGLTSGGATR